MVISTSCNTWIIHFPQSPNLFATYPLSEFHRAQTDFMAKKYIGKLVVMPDRFFYSGLICVAHRDRFDLDHHALIREIAKRYAG